MQPDLVERTFEQAVRRGMAGLSGRGIVGVSGGPDSVALLRALLRCGFVVQAAHLHHGLRGAAADADQAFVEQLCATLGVPCRVRQVNVAAARGNREAAGRAARYAFFAELAAQEGAAWVAVGHTADDQAETVLQRLIRGTGLAGLAGIPPQRPLPLPDGRSVPLVRPLLTLRRADILQYLQALRQSYCDDASNRLLCFTRNRIRHQLLPLLEQWNPRVVEALGRLAAQAAEAEEVLEAAAGRLLQQAERPRAGQTVVLDAATLQQAPPLLQRLAMRLLWRREGWPLRDMDHAAWEQAARLISQSEGMWDFPGGVRLRRHLRVVQLWQDRYTR